jgi:hypothetical protein
VCIENTRKACKILVTKPEGDNLKVLGIGRIILK